MAIKRWRRKQLRKPDEFVGFWERAWQWLRTRLVPAAIGVGATVIVLVAAGVWTSVSTKRAEAATADLTRALEISGAPLLADGEEDAGDKGVARFRTAKERAEAALKALDAVEKRGGAIAREARLVRAGALADAARLDEAVSAYRRYLGDASDRDPLRAVAHEGLGYALEAKGDLAGALAEFRAMSIEDDYRDRRLWHEGRIAQKKGDKEQSRKAYQSILDDEKLVDSSLRDDAQARLAALDE